MAVIPLPAGSYSQSSGFGDRDGTLHAGVDYAAAAGTHISAALPGKVVSAGFNNGGWGYQVVVDDGIVNGQHVYTRYAHMEAAPSVSVGQSVTAGQLLGLVGSTGDSTGNHLHFGTYVGGTENANAVNPATILKGATAATGSDDDSGLLGILNGALGAIPGVGPLVGVGEAEADSALNGLQAAILAVFQKIGAAADEFSTKAKLLEQIATAGTHLLLPNNLLRVAAGGLGFIFLLFSLYFLVNGAT
jgi:hypothetical protein